MADDVGKKELVGYYSPGYEPDYGPGCGPGYGTPDGMHLYKRLNALVGTNVTAVFADGSIIRGALHAVGRDYAEIHRVRDTAREAVFVPLQSTVIIGPIR